jgi:TMEM175 potassium channel family protein
VTKARLEAFSDGVFAVAITLLVLEIDIPEAGGDLAHQVGELWPSFAAYAVSFFTIGIIWVNHHTMSGSMRAVDRTTLFLNLNLLLWVVLIPWTTAVIAEHLRVGGDSERLAAAMYAANFLIMGFAFGLVWRHAARAGLGASADPAVARSLSRRNAIGQGGYVLALALAWVSAPASLAVCGLVALYYVHPGPMSPWEDQASP